MINSDPMRDEADEACEVDVSTLVKQNIILRNENRLYKDALRLALNDLVPNDDTTEPEKRRALIEEGEEMYVSIAEDLLKERAG